MSSPDHSNTIRRLFATLCDLDPGDRLRELDRIADAGIREKLVRLLEADQRSDSGLDRGLDSESAALRDGIRDGERPVPQIDGYEIVGRIGVGSMGTVYEARQYDPPRIVAIKVLRSSLASEAHRRRFQVEAEALARLRHPGIAQIYATGVVDHGDGEQPYLVMERIEGAPITQFAVDRELSRSARIELMVDACEAVQHAHRNGVIHRDLKPANLLVEAQPTRPKVVDFGVARLADRGGESIPDSNAETVPNLSPPGTTLCGEILGTLAWMSPEQSTGEIDRVDVRSDVYSLGVILFELLSGRLPQPIQGLSLEEALRRIREDDAPLLGDCDRSLRGDLEAITGRALAKNPDQRYSTASALAEDLRRYLRDEPVLAHPPSARYQWIKFARRNRAWVWGSALVLLALIAGIVGTSYGLFEANRRANEATRERHAAQESRERAERVTQFLATLLTSGDLERLGRNARVKDALDSAAATLPDLDDGVLEARVRSILGSAYLRLTEYDSAEEQLRAARRLSVDAEIPASLVLRIRSEWSSLRAAQGHFREARSEVQALLPLLEDDPALRAEALSTLSLTELQVGRVADAEGPAREALDVRRREFGPEAALTLRSMGHLANVLNELGQDDEAEQLCRDGLAVSKERLGSTHPATLILSHALASLALERQEFERAKSIFEESVSNLEKAFGPDHHFTLSARANLARLHYERGELETAYGIQAEELDRSRIMLGAEHPDVLNSEFMLGRIAMDLRRFEESVVLLEHCYVERQRQLGPVHDRTVRAGRVLATVLRHRRKRGDAAAVLGSVHEALSPVRDPLDRQRLQVASDLGAVLAETGELEAAESILRVNSPLQAQALGADHPETMRTIHNLASLLRRKEDYEEAETLFQDVLERRARVLGEDHPQTQLSRDNLAFLYLAKGDTAQAVDAYRAVLASKERRFGEAHPQVANACLLLSRAYLATDRFTEAEAVTRRACELLDQQLGLDHAQSVMSRVALGRILNRQERFEDARVLLEEGDVRYEDRWRDPSSVATALVEWGVSLAALGQGVRARELLDRARSVTEAAPVRPSVLEAIEALSVRLSAPGS